MKTHTIQAVVVAGTGSGCGKTTLTLGLMAALRRRGLRVAPFKVGPDFIDPGHHERITDRPSHNLDTWMLPLQVNREVFARHTRGCDIAIIEGVMGLYDGISGTDETGSTASLAKALGLPVLLTVSAASMGRSVAAVVAGYTGFDPELDFAGVVLNQVGGEAHRVMLWGLLRPYPVCVFLAVCSAIESQHAVATSWFGYG